MRGMYKKPDTVTESEVNFSNNYYTIKILGELIRKVNYGEECIKPATVVIYETPTPTSCTLLIPLPTSQRLIPTFPRRMIFPAISYWY